MFNQKEKSYLIFAGAIVLLVLSFFSLVDPITRSTSDGNSRIRTLRDVLSDPLSINRALKIGKNTRNQGSTKDLLALFKTKKKDNLKPKLVAKGKKKVTKKKVAKKKKKKKKKKKPSLEIEVVEKKEDDFVQNESIELDDNPYINSAKQEDEEDQTRTEEEWIEYLFNAPSVEKFEEFLLAHRTNEVDIDMYYRITLLLLESNRLELNKYGLLALASTPSYTSFAHLAIVAEDHPKSKIQNKAKAELNTYSSLKHLALIRNALSDDVSVIRYHGARLIGISADRNLISIDPDSGDRGLRDPNDPNTANIIQNSEKYIPLIEVLDRVANNDSVGIVREAAFNSARIIDERLGSIQVANTPPSVPSEPN